MLRINRMWELLNSLDPNTYLPNAQIDQRQYTKILLEQNEEYEIWMICWKAGQSTPIHDHPEGGCWMQVVQGSLEETEYACPTMYIMGTNRLDVGNVGFKQGRVLLHSIKALEDTISLHLYKPPKYKANTYTRDL